jgi:outer membrane protein assembly factor BamB
MMIRRPLRLGAVVPGARAATPAASGDSPPTATGIAHTRGSAMAMPSIPGQRRRVSRMARVLIGLLLVVSSLPAGRLLTPVGVAAASAVVTLKARSGPPTTVTTVRGSGFGASETIDVYFDTTDLVLASTNSTGGFSVKLTVPATAAPGRHWITADARATRLSAQAAFTVGTNWLSFRDGPSRSGVNPYENVLNPSTVGGLNEQWATTTGDSIFSSAAYSSGYLYVGSFDDNVYKLNATTGAVVWTYTTGGPVYSSPTVTGGVVYVGSLDDSIYAINARTGAKLWSTATDGPVDSSPVVVSDVMYVGSADNNVYALNATTGAVMWTYATGGGIFSSPAVVNGVLYTGSDGGMYALSASTGALKWSDQTLGPVYSSPAVANGLVYVESTDGYMYALNAAVGAITWSAPVALESESSAAVVNGVVYIGGFDGTVNAFNASSGALKWSQTIATYVESSPAVANGVVYIGTHQANLDALDAATGAILWSASTGGSVIASPTVANGAVYVGSADDNVYAYSLGVVLRPNRPKPSSLHPNLGLKVSA